MQELIKQLTERAGISDEQAEKVLHTIRDFVKEKFPMMAGAVDNLLGPDTNAAAASAASPGASTEAEGFMDVAKNKLGGFFGENK